MQSVSGVQTLMPNAVMCDILLPYNIDINLIRLASVLSAYIVLSVPTTVGYLSQ